jgi:CRISPR/Cas system CMR-associated protein Cmr5 small subunit
MKALLAQDVLVRYPDHNHPFHVYTDASDYQLGSVIMQDGAPVAFYSRKLNTAQRNYTTIEKELLSIMETLKEFKTMLFGCPGLHVHTDHRNLTFNALNSQRVIRWRLFLEEFNPIFHYVKGTDNILADALSRLPRWERQNPSIAQAMTPAEQRVAKVRNPSGEPDEHTFLFLSDDDDFLECFLNFPTVAMGQPFALDYHSIQTAQNADQ